MQNHNAKIKNSAYRPIRTESAENLGAPEDYILKNKANLQNAKMNVNLYDKKDYDSEPRRRLQKNKPNQACPFDKPLRGKLRAGSDQRRMEPNSPTQERKVSSLLCREPLICHCEARRAVTISCVLGKESHPCVRDCFASLLRK